MYSSQRGYRRTWDEDYEFSLLGVEMREPAGHSPLSVSYEPGANLIWASLYVSIIGFAMMFLLSHRKLWVKLEKRDGSHHLTLGGWASRDPGVPKGSFKDIKELVREYTIT